MLHVLGKSYQRAFSVLQLPLAVYKLPQRTSHQLRRFHQLNMATAQEANVAIPTAVPNENDSNVPVRPAKAPKAPKEKEASVNVSLKTPKGTRDWFGADVLLREHILATTREVYNRHGAQPLDTPVFELREILAGKLGEGTIP
jgi:hypothetical protein